MGNSNRSTRQARKRRIPWHHIIAIVGIVVGLPGLYFAYRAIPIARVDFVVSDQTPLFSWKASAGPKFTLLVDDREVQSASVVSVWIENSGTVDLIPHVPDTAEHEQNPKLSFRAALGCELLSVHWDPNVGDPSNVFTQISGDSQAAEFSVRLMNKGARARFLVYLTNCNQPKPVACIAKGKGVLGRVVPMGEEGWRSSWPAVFLILVSLILAALVIRTFRRAVLEVKPTFRFFADDAQTSFVSLLRNLFIAAVMFALFLGIVTVCEWLFDLIYKEFIL